ncbi:uncharacterized protein THITE_2059949, partial [Thermothielavioides terrestris NRRL 8126]
KTKRSKTYSTGDSLVVTDPTTNPAVGSLSRGERTGSRVLYHLWPYMSGSVKYPEYKEWLHYGCRRSYKAVDDGDYGLAEF